VGDAVKPAGVGLAAALREECRFLLKGVGWRPLSRAGPFPIYRNDAAAEPLRLVITGIGPQRAAAGVEWLLQDFSPKAVLSIGFAGALDPGLEVGDLLWGRVVLCRQAGRIVEEHRLALPEPETLQKPPSGVSWSTGTFVSVDAFVEKAEVRAGLGGQYAPAVLEMETFALNSILAEHGIPLFGLRAVSDEWTLEFAREMQRWTDAQLRIVKRRLVRDALLRPGRLRLLFGLYRRSQRASQSLAAGVSQILTDWSEKPS
jgi:adenosylhomocysteine nucleosidase